jgi:hypothetical protein
MPLVFKTKDLKYALTFIFHFFGALLICLIKGDLFSDKEIILFISISLQSRSLLSTDVNIMRILLILEIALIGIKLIIIVIGMWLGSQKKLNDLTYLEQCAPKHKILYNNITFCI